MFFETCYNYNTCSSGKCFRKRSVKQTTTSIEELSNIQITQAKIERNGEVLLLEFNEIKVNDILIVSSGDKIAVDGIIIEGTASVDESMITGESIPIDKSIDDHVIGGTILLSGSIKIKAKKVGKDTLLSNIIGLVKNVKIIKSKIQKNWR